jgi:hypothetical protein
MSTQPTPLVEAAPNHIPIAIFGGVAFALVMCFWAYHFGSLAACH